MFVFRFLRLVLRDVFSQSCLHQFLLEFVGTALFLSASLSTLLIRGDKRSTVCPLQVVLVFGLSVSMAALSVGGAVHLNPAVSLAMALTLRLRLWRAVLYMVGQLLGGVASALSFPSDSTACVQVSSGVRLHQAFTVEALITLQLVLVVMVTAEVPLPVGATPLLVGLTVSLGHLVAVGATGCGMNPARSFGPAAVTLNFKDHWVFWAGPILGACVAALLNDLLLRPVCLNLQEEPVVFSGPTGSLFGFSIDFHPVNNT
uniref:Aquaporin-1-like n=1 Tax=Cyprinodon variegatus TaxID=28743 RepID=A0A3Q2C8E0_CYPVA